MTRAGPRIGVSTGCYHGFGVPTEDAVASIAGLGVDAIELFVQGLPELEPEVSRVIVERVRLSRLGVVSVHPYVFGWENLLFASYERQRRWAWDHVRAHLALCQATGADAYVSHGPPAHHVLAPDGTLLPLYVRTARELVVLAEDHGVRYCLENVSYGLVRTPDDVRRHRDVVPGLRFVIDFKSAWKAGHAPAEFLAEDLLPAVHHTQVSFRRAGRYGLPAPPGDVPDDAELAAGLAVRTTHILEVEATDAGQVARSVAALRGLRSAAVQSPASYPWRPLSGDRMTSAIESDLAHLRDPRTRANLAGRSRIRSAARSSLEEQGFLEVDTPAVGERVDEYAAGHLRVSLADGTQLWLAQSPQIYKQALIATGTERYFQFAHCFRDEDREPGRTDYLREFIQLDVEMRATSIDELITVAERLVHRIFAHLGKTLPPSPFARISADEALSRYGSDKPDLRDGVDQTSCLWVIDFPLATNGTAGPVLDRHPMAMPHTTPASADDLTAGRSHSFDLVINGYEIASGDLRIHDPAIQRAVLEAAGLGRIS